VSEEESLSFATNGGDSTRRSGAVEQVGSPVAMAVWVGPRGMGQVPESRTVAGRLLAPTCPKLCGGRLRKVESTRWGRYWRCGRCGHECPMAVGTPARHAQRRRR
jgi:hypothetical protein